MSGESIDKTRHLKIAIGKTGSPAAGGSLGTEPTEVPRDDGGPTRPPGPRDDKDLRRPNAERPVTSRAQREAAAAPTSACPQRRASGALIALLRRERVFERLGQRKSRRIVAEIVRRADYEYDCRSGEILDGHGAALGLCYYCLKPADDVVADICGACRKESGGSDEELTVFRARKSAWASPERDRGLGSRPR